jgi:hypothetical protein
MTLGNILDTERQAMVYALVCMRPGEKYYFYARNAWGSYSGKVYDELEALANKKLIWYMVTGGWRGSKLVGSGQFKETKRYYPTYEVLAKTADPKHGAYPWLLREYNEVLREAIERVPGRSSAKEPCVIVSWRKRDIDIATARIKVAGAKRATVAICGDLDAWQEFVNPYRYLVDRTCPVCVLHVEDDELTKSNAQGLRGETGADIRSLSVEGRLASMTIMQSRRIEQDIVSRVSSYPWVRLSVKPTSHPSKRQMRAEYCRLNLVDDTVILPVYTPNSRDLREYRAVVLRHPDVAADLYKTFGELFDQVQEAELTF